MRIPTAAVTGTGGTTTTALMLHHMWVTAGSCAGVCTATDVRVGPDVVTVGDLSGYRGAEILLGDPAVESAIIELPAEGLRESGHPCDRYDVAALLGIRGGGIGLEGEVLRRAAGAVVLNADDPRCMAMREQAGTDRHILVSRSPDRVAAHRNSGGEAVFAGQCDGSRWIVVAVGDTETPLLPVRDISASEDNAMFAAGLAWAQGLGMDTIRVALRTFNGEAR